MGKLEDSNNFLKRVLNLKDDLFHSNLIFLGNAVKEIGNRIKDEKIIKKILRRFMELWQSRDDFIHSIESKKNIILL